MSVHVWENWQLVAILLESGAGKGESLFLFSPCIVSLIISSRYVASPPYRTRTFTPSISFHAMGSAGSPVAEAWGVDVLVGISFWLGRRWFWNCAASGSSSSSAAFVDEGTRVNWLSLIVSVLTGAAASSVSSGPADAWGTDVLVATSFWLGSSSGCDASIDEETRVI